MCVCAAHGYSDTTGLGLASVVFCIMHESVFCTVRTFAWCWLFEQSKMRTEHLDTLYLWWGYQCLHGTGTEVRPPIAFVNLLLHWCLQVGYGTLQLPLTILTSYPSATCRRTHFIAFYCWPLPSYVNSVGLQAAVNMPLPRSVFSIQLKTQAPYLTCRVRLLSAVARLPLCNHFQSQLILI